MKTQRHQDEEELVICTDSKSAIQGIMKYNNRHPIVKDIVDEITRRSEACHLCWIPSQMRLQIRQRWILPQIIISKIAVFLGRGYMASAKDIITKHWQQQWDNLQNNKLRKIKDHTKACRTSRYKNREWERKLARLRLGHTRFLCLSLTHLYKLFYLVGVPLCVPKQNS